MSTKHPLAPHQLPAFISQPGSPDYLLVAMAVFLVLFVLAIGIIYLRLHALPDHIAHRSQKIQMEIVCVLCLLAMFTGSHAFWIAALLLALVDIPDFGTPLRRISSALERLAEARDARKGPFGAAAETGAVAGKTPLTRMPETPRLPTPPARQAGTPSPEPTAHAHSRE